MRVVGGGVEARLVVGDAHPGGEVLGEAEAGELGRQLAAFKHARPR